MYIISLICFRLDAGTFGTMGVGTGFAIAAALLAESQADGSNLPRRVVCVQGDSAFGFSGMEIETASRYVCSFVWLGILHPKLAAVMNIVFDDDDDDYNDDDGDGDDDDDDDDDVLAVMLMMVVV